MTSAGVSTALIPAAPAAAQSYGRHYERGYDQRGYDQRGYDDRYQGGYRGEHLGFIERAEQLVGLDVVVDRPRFVFVGLNGLERFFGVAKGGFA